MARTSGKRTSSVESVECRQPHRCGVQNHKLGSAAFLKCEQSNLHDQIGNRKGPPPRTIRSGGRTPAGALPGSGSRSSASASRNRQRAALDQAERIAEASRVRAQRKAERAEARAVRAQQRQDRSAKKREEKQRAAESAQRAATAAWLSPQRRALKSMAGAEAKELTAAQTDALNDAIDDLCDPNNALVQVASVLLDEKHWKTRPSKANHDLCQDLALAAQDLSGETLGSRVAETVKDALDETEATPLLKAVLSRALGDVTVLGVRGLVFSHLAAPLLGLSALVCPDPLHCPCNKQKVNGLVGAMSERAHVFRPVPMAPGAGPTAPRWKIRQRRFAGIRPSGPTTDSLRRQSPR